MQEREGIVLEMLEKIPKQNLVLIGGYAVNAYVPPRFSIDCDLVVLGSSKRVELALKSNGFVKTEAGEVPNGSYARYFRKGEKVSFDLFINSVLDRNTEIVFEGELFKKYSRKRVTVGRANPIRIEMRIAEPEILFATKFVSARKQDIRDIFMLAGQDPDGELIARIISEKCNAELVQERIMVVRRTVRSEDYRDSLHGPFGMIPDERYDACKNRLLEFLKILEKSKS